MEKVEYMEIKEELHTLIESLSTDQMQKTCAWTRAEFGDASIKEMERWWGRISKPNPESL